jgi:pimeloyl-ACP methyl ester carboxylesterase
MASCVDEPMTVVAGSNGVSVGLRLALDRPDLLSKLVLLWPATARDPMLDATVPPAAKHLLPGDTVRGTTDIELRTVLVPVAVMAANPENPFHQHRTVDQLVALLPGATRIPQAFPEAPRADFAATLHQFIAVLTNHL